MKFSTVVAASSLLVGTALAAKAADNIEDIIKQLPQCAQDCIPDGLKDAGCKDKDYDCGCDNFTSFTFGLSKCVAGAVLSGDCSLDDASKLEALSSGACVDFTDDEIKDIEDALSSIGAPITSGIEGITSLVDSATSKIGDITSRVGDITTTPTPDGDAESSEETNSPGAGPMVTPMAWAGAAAVVAALAL